MKAIFLSLAASTATICNGFCQEAPTKTDDISPAMAAVTANDRAYEEAYAKADLAALVGFFTEDAEYTSDDGRNFSGRASIEACLKEAFSDKKGAKIAITADSVKLITPEVAVEKGSTTVIGADGESESLYTAIHVKKDGKWKISQLIETPMPETTPTERLSVLSWLIGSWEEADKEAGVTVHSTYSWARGGSFITRNVTVKRGDDSVLEGWQIIGWDPLEEKIRSWTFDDGGGFSGGLWTRDGDRWLVRETGTAADGSRTSADQTLSRAGDDKFFWESGNRTLDGDPQPGIGRIEIKRVKGE
ncbi:MAG: SgcJ/EcaC family oxidoreductase [Luteolibacter sp.]